MSTTEPLRVLVVDDEQPALDEIVYQLDKDERIGPVTGCLSASEALRVLRDTEVDVVFLDVAMPGLDGLELASVLSRFKQPPHVVFVTAHTEHAVDAFDLHAVDYLLKPVREDRLREAVRRVTEVGAAPPSEDTIPVELGGVTRFVQRSEVRYVEAQGDYARLHTASGSHLVRLPLVALEQRWAEHGFLRIHRSLLIALHHVDEVRVEEGRCTVLLDGTVLQASRRHAPELRERLRLHRQEIT
jgi:DNA-binding LytR/AlgR family response regulator